MINFKACALALAAFAATPAVADSVHDMASWTLRFGDKKTIRSALTGCYGTASYRYVLPPVSYVDAYIGSLRDAADAADLSGFVFTSTRDDSDDYVVVDLATGERGTVSQAGSVNEKGIVMCLCDERWTQSQDRDGRPNCSPMQLPPLGASFLVERDDLRSPSNPAPSDPWIDSVTNWSWYMAAPAVNWDDAMGICGDGYELPEIAVIGHALPRLRDSRLGVQLRDADAVRVWSNEEFDWMQAMAVWIGSGNAGSVNKRTLYPALCVKR
jgi:hypothetical protein